MQGVGKVQCAKNLTNMEGERLNIDNISFWGDWLGVWCEGTVAVSPFYPVISKLFKALNDCGVPQPHFSSLLT